MYARIHRGERPFDVSLHPPLGILSALLSNSPADGSAGAPNAGTQLHAVYTGT
jgi:hypothetical protein